MPVRRTMVRPRREPFLRRQGLDDRCEWMRNAFSIVRQCSGEMPTRLSFDRVATIYDETRGLAPRAMTRLLAVLVDEFQRKRVLEVGVGTGRYAVPLQKSGVRVVGVDISRNMVGLGLAKGLRDIVFADGARLPF